MTRLGIFGVILMYLGVAGVVSYTAPVNANGDTPAHLDYAWRISRGEIPTRKEGITYPPFVEIRGYRQQQQAAHPPLFYILQAPLVAPLMNSGNWKAAVLVGRTFNLLIGVLGILALGYAGWVFGGSKKALYAVTVPALSALTYRYTRLNLDYSFDALLVFFSTLSLVFSYKVLTEGVSKRYFLILLLLSVLGMSTKAPYAIFLFISIASILVATIIHEKKPNQVKVLMGLSRGIIMFAVVLVVIGWFYYLWNYRVNGNWFTARPNGYTGGRVPKTLSEVLTSKSLWRLFYGDISRYIRLSIAILGVATFGVLKLSTQEIKKLAKDKFLIIKLILLVAAVVGIFATQIEHAVGVGAINFRYMLPAVVAFGLYFSFGLTQAKSARGQLVTISAITLAVSSVHARADGVLSNIIDTSGSIYVFKNVLVALLLICLSVGTVVLARSLYALSVPKPK